MSKIKAVSTIFWFMYGRPPEDHESIVWLYFDMVERK